MQRLTCRSCGACLRAGDFDRRKAILRCSHCETLVDLGKATAAPEADLLEPGQNAVQTKPRAVAALPEGWTMERTKNRLEIGFKASNSEDRSGKAIRFLRWCTVLCAALALFHLLVEQDNRSAVVLGMAVPICLVLMLLLRWRRRSMYLKTDRRHLWLDRWLAFKPLIRVPTADVVQLYVAEQVQQFDDDRIGPYSTRTSTDYHLCAGLRAESGSKVLVIATFDSPRTALFLEQIFEEFLGIDDRHVPGEVDARSFAM